MWNYYAGAEECHAYLQDVVFEAPGRTETVNRPHWRGLGPDDKPLAYFPGFSDSRWFRRGWTLQELIAPTVVVFLSCDWEIIGLKNGRSRKDSDSPDRLDGNYRFSTIGSWTFDGFTEIVRELSAITGIPRITLMNPDYGLRHANVATKMSWMAKRSTSRVEDETYCLLGLFNLNIPLLYGEGDCAFFRLLGEIIRTSADESVFCSEVQDLTLLASKPQDYANGLRFSVKRARSIERVPYLATNQGLRFEILPGVGAYVDCSTDEKAPDWILIRLNVSTAISDGPRHIRSWHMAGEQLAGRFLYVQRLTCGHYVRRHISQRTILRVLSKDQVGWNASDETSSRDQHRADRHSEAAAEIGSHLVIYIHFDPSQSCKGILGELKLLNSFPAGCKMDIMEQARREEESYGQRVSEWLEMTTECHQVDMGSSMRSKSVGEITEALHHDSTKTETQKTFGSRRPQSEPMERKTEPHLGLWRRRSTGDTDRLMTRASLMTARASTHFPQAKRWHSPPGTSAATSLHSASLQRPGSDVTATTAQARFSPSSDLFIHNQHPSFHPLRLSRRRW